MSNLLNRTSLELMDLETDSKHARKKGNKSKGILDLIPNSYKVVKNKRKTESLKYNVPHHQFSKIRVHSDKKRSATQNDGSTELNLQRLLQLSSDHIDLDITEKLFNRATKKRAILQDETLEKEEKTVFTEEDFRNFADEYFNN